MSDQQENALFDWAFAGGALGSLALTALAMVFIPDFVLHAMLGLGGAAVFLAIRGWKGM